MRYHTLIVALLFGCASSIPLKNASHINATETSSLAVGVVSDKNFGHVDLSSRARWPLNRDVVTVLLQSVRLAIYRFTLSSQGDGPLVDMTFPYHRPDGRLSLSIKAFSYQLRMTLGSSFYTVLQLLRAMLNPTQPGEGLFETRWLILRISPRGQDIPMGSLELVVPNIVK